MNKFTRRELLKAGGTAGGLLILGISLPGCTKRPDTNGAIMSFEPNLFVSMDADGLVSITVSRSEMGQGVHTSFAADRRR